METKTCKKCNIEKQLNMFPFRKETNNYRNDCKLCMNDRDKQLKINKFSNYEWNCNPPNELKCNSCGEVKENNCFYN